LQLIGILTLFTTEASDSPLSKEILECEIPKKFSTPTFNCYSGVVIWSNTSVIFETK